MSVVTSFEWRTGVVAWCMCVWAKTAQMFFCWTYVKHTMGEWAENTYTEHDVKYLYWKDIEEGVHCNVCIVLYDTGAVCDMACATSPIFVSFNIVIIGKRQTNSLLDLWLVNIYICEELGQSARNTRRQAAIRLGKNITMPAVYTTHSSWNGKHTEHKR